MFVDGLKLFELPQRLHQIQSKLSEIEARLGALADTTAAKKPMTLRQFTEQLNDQTSNNQEADSFSRSAITESHEAG
jgi:hypothetical protein